MNDSRRLSRLFRLGVSRRWPLLIVPTWVAVTLFLAGVASASAVNAALFILGALALVSVLLAGWLVSSGRGDAADQASPAALPPSIPDHRVPVVFLPACARMDEVAPALFSRQCYFPVAQGGEVVGVLSKAALLRAVARGWGDRLIVELMAQNGPAADAAEGKTEGQTSRIEKLGMEVQTLTPEVAKKLDLK